VRVKGEVTDAPQSAAVGREQRGAFAPDGILQRAPSETQN